MAHAGAITVKVNLDFGGQHMTPIQAAWLVGVLEGEGCFDLAKGKYPRIRLGMTDSDVVRRAAELMGTTVYTEFRPNGYKPMFKTEVWGARAADLMEAMLPSMGARRSSKIVSVLGEYRQSSVGRAA